MLRRDDQHAVFLDVLFSGSLAVATRDLGGGQNIYALMCHERCGRSTWKKNKISRSHKRHWNEF